MYVGNQMVSGTSLQTNMAATRTVIGQHSLTSVERPSYLRSNFGNVRRHARLVVHIYL